MLCKVLCLIFNTNRLKLCFPPILFIANVFWEIITLSIKKVNIEQFVYGRRNTMIFVPHRSALQRTRDMSVDWSGIRDHKSYRLSSSSWSFSYNSFLCWPARKAAPPIKFPCRVFDKGGSRFSLSPLNCCQGQQKQKETNSLWEFWCEKFAAH